MSNNNTTNTSDNLHNRPDEFTRDGGGAQEEPYASVRRARVRRRNLRTGDPTEGVSPAKVNEPSARRETRSLSVEAVESPITGRGSADNPFPDRENETEDDTSSQGETTELDESDIESIFGSNTNDEETHQTLRPTPAALKGKRMEMGPKPGRRIASLNMRGRLATDKGKKINKFKLIRNWMTNEKISVMALLDTHWDQEMQDSLQKEYPTCSFHCSHETTQRGGIALVVNEKQGKPNNIDFQTLEKGRSAIIRVKYDTQEILMATAYLPNKTEEKKQALKRIRKNLEKIRDKKDLILTGDFNMVEDAIDRCPPHTDEQQVVAEMIRLKASLDIVDGWRNAHEDELDYTWEGSLATGYSQSRIDRIMVTNELLPHTNEWEIIKMEKTISDHAAVTVKLLEKDPPFIGRGEWRLNLKTLEHPHFRERATKRIEDLSRDLKSYWRLAKATGEDERRLTELRKRTNPQTLWIQYKTAIRVAATEAEQKKRSAILKERRKLEKQQKKTKLKLTRNPNAENAENLREEMRSLSEALSKMTTDNRHKAEDTIAAKWFKEGESGSKMWYGLNKERPQRQIFHSLLKADGQTETRNTDEMMDIAYNHHETLQKKPEMNEEREDAIRETLSKVTTTISDDHKQKLTEEITYGEIRETMTKSKNGKTPGCDGIPNEFWKQEIEWYKQQQRANEMETDPRKKKNRPDIVTLMKLIFHDIDEHGSIDENFAEARMSLLYKKKDRRQIVNYRPITLLNTDYKIYTTVLTKRLNEVAPTIIHPDQAGFMPKRSIYNQTKIVELVIKLCENEEKNGLIVALDQEKAYDRIDHEYLWRTMKTYGFPDIFINRIKNLYKNAQTAIRINGCTTGTFRVERGVRQGDPLSCLLYNIAIEPLFEIIRKSKLEGIEIHRFSENALVNAYADDTTVFLSERDRPEDLNKCIDLFCKASTAKFNEEKTEMIPVGSIEFRTRILTERIYNGYNIPNDIHIAKEGEAIRILGAWIGNGVNQIAQWNKILETQTKVMKAWARCYPTLRGRILITKTLIASRAFYLMTVNGIPSDTLSQMEKNIRSFIWAGKKGSIAWNRAILPRKEGGLAAPSMKTIYEGTKIQWLQRWLNPEGDRPKWAWAANAILEGAAQENPKLDYNSTTEWIEQKWKAKIRSKLIPQSLRDVLKVAIKHNAKISILRAPMELKLSMPAFFHPGSNTNRLNNTKMAKCLRNNHGINTVEDLVRFHKRLDRDEEHKCKLTVRKCRKFAGHILKSLNDKWNPLTDSPEKHDLYHTPERLKEFQEANIKESAITFNPDPRDGTKTLKNVRIFGSRKGYIKDPKHMNTPGNPVRINDMTATPKTPRRVRIYTDGATKLNGWENATAGLGVYYGPEDDRNAALKIPGKGLTNQRAELAAILTALRENSRNDIIIYSDSLSSLNTIVHHLNDKEDHGWHKTKNSDLLKEILSHLRTRPGKSEFKWVKGHAQCAGNNEADKLAEKGRTSDDEMLISDLEPTPELGLHEGARLCTLKMKDIYSILIDIQNKNKENITHPEILEDTKNLIETETSLRPTTEMLINGIWRMPAFSRMRDHAWNLLIGRIKCGKYWLKIPDYEERAYCLACFEHGEREILETEHHIWADCNYNGQIEAWKYAKRIWHRTTPLRWPRISIGVIRGIGALTLPDENGNPITGIESKRLRIIMNMTVWAIWKVRNKRSINNLSVHRLETEELTRELLTDLITKQWNSIRFEPEDKRPKKENQLRNLWEHGELATFEKGHAPTFRL